MNTPLPMHSKPACATSLAPAEDAAEAARAPGRRLSRLAWLLLGVFALAGLPACQSAGRDAQEAESLAPPVDHRLREGDVIQIVFPGATNLNAAQKIPADGQISLPFVGRIEASGQTPEEVQRQILARYGDQLQLKEVTVTVLSTSATVYLSGAVLKPGRIPLERPLTVLEAVMEAGGFIPDRARVDRVAVIRNENGKHVTYRLDLKAVLDGKETESFYLKAFDVVHVPAKRFNF